MWAWHLQLGAPITSAALSIYLALCSDPLAFHQNIQQTKSIPTTCRGVRNSSEVSEWRFNSSKYFTTFIKSSHVQEGMFPRRYFSLPYTRNSQLLVTFWSQELQPHTVSQTSRAPAETPDWSSHLWDHTTGLGVDALWKLPRTEITQLPLQATCSKAQIFPGKNPTLPVWMYLASIACLHFSSCCCSTSLERQALCPPSAPRHSGAALCSPSWTDPVLWGLLPGCAEFLTILRDPLQLLPVFIGLRSKNQRHRECLEGTIPSQSTLKRSSWAARCQYLPHSRLL